MEREQESRYRRETISFLAAIPIGIFPDPSRCLANKVPALGTYAANPVEVLGLLAGGFLIGAIFFLIHRLIFKEYHSKEGPAPERPQRGSEARHHALFEDFPISLWVEDFSRVKQRLDTLRGQGVEDIESYLIAHPEIVAECAALIKVKDVNRAGLKLYKVADKTELIKNIDRFIEAGSNQSFRDELVQIALGKLEFEFEGTNLTSSGEKLNVIVRWSVMPGSEDTLDEVLVSITDITPLKKSEEALRESETLFRATFEHSPVGVGVIAPGGRYLMANQRLCDMLGYSEPELRTRTTVDMTHPDDIPGTQEQVRQLLSGEIDEADVEKRYIHRTGRVIWAQRVTALLRDSQGKPRYFITQVQDISRRRQAEDELTTANAKLTAWLGDLEARTHEMATLNEMVSFLQTCRAPEDAYAVLGKMAPSLFPGDGGALALIHASRKAVEAITAWGDPVYTRNQFRMDDCWALKRARPHLVPDSHHALACRHLTDLPPAYICVPLIAQGDVLGCLHVNTSAGGLSDRKQQLAKMVADAIALSLANLRLRENLRQQSIIDVLTGLFNRRYMEETLERELRRAARAKCPLGIIMADIDHFKNFNDAHGHAAGDILLGELGSYLRSHIRAEDVACRYGGEEFTLILPGSDLKATAGRAESLRSGVSSLRVEYGGHTLETVTLSFGVAAFPKHGASGAELLRAADKALYRAKREGRDRVVTQ